MIAAYLSEAQKLILGDAAAGEPLVTIRACGVCQSDFKAFANPPANMHLPRVLGHEIVGILEKDRPEQGLCRGDRVALWPALCCGKCYYCKSGRENLCPEVQIFGYHLDGGFRTGFSFSVDREKNLRLYKIPEKLSFTEAVFAEPLACVLNALEKVVFIPKSCLVVGAGGMGRLAIRAIQSRWPSKVFVHDIDAWRLQQAESECQRSQGEEVDLVFMAASTGLALEYGLDHLAPGGMALLFSGMDRDDTSSFAIPHNRVHQKEQQLTGAYGCCPRHIKDALRLMETDAVPVADLISRTMELTDLPQVLAEKDYSEYKTVIICDENN